MFSTGYLNDHVKSFHEEHDDYKCKLCGKLVASKQQLERHVMNVHEKTKNYTCDICGKLFRQDT